MIKKLLIFLFLLVFLNSKIAVAAGDEVAWSSYDKGFCPVTVQGFSYPSEEKDSTLTRVKALASLYQGLPAEGQYNTTPNFASITIDLDVEHSGERHKVSFPIREDGKLIYFSSSNRGVYGKEVLSDLFMSLLEESPNFIIYTYANLSKEAEKGFIVEKEEKGVHSEELMLIYMNSERYRQSFWNGVIKKLTEDFPTNPITIKGSRVAIHSWWGVCTSCQRQLRDRNRLFSLPVGIEEGSRVVLSKDSYILFSFFSEMPYSGAPKDLSRKPAEVSIDSPVGFSASRRNLVCYEEVFNEISTKIDRILEVVAPLERPARRARLVIEDVDEEEEAESVKEAPNKLSRDVLRAIAMIYTHPNNIEVLTPNEDTLERFFRVVSTELWQFPFAHQYSLPWRISLIERLEAGTLKESKFKYSPFLLPYEEKKKDKKTNPSLLLLNGTRKEARGEESYLSELQKKWFKFRPMIFGFPHFGWTEIAVVEVEEGLGLSVGGKAFCQMCGNSRLFNLHQVRHDDAKTDLFVGSECVRSMTLSQERVLESMGASRDELKNLLFPKPKGTGKGRLKRRRSWT